MTIFVFANNVNTTLAGAVSTSATTITLSSTANLPTSIPNGSVLVITLNDIATRQNYEIVYATAIAGATLTVLRGQEGTAALAWLVGDFAYSPPTAGQQNSFGQLAGTNTWTGNDTFSNPVTVANATTAGHALNLGQADATFALINGSSSQVFNVSPAVANAEAVNLGQFSSSIAANGYSYLPNGLLIQWGVSNASGAVSFPITFPNQCFSITASVANGSNSTPYFITTLLNNQSAFTAFAFNSPTGNNIGSVAFYWQAIGH